MSEGWVAFQVTDLLTDIRNREEKMMEEFKADIPEGMVDGGVHERMLAKARTDAWISGAQTMKAIMLGIMGAAVAFVEFSSDDLEIEGFVNALEARMADVLLPDAPQ